MASEAPISFLKPRRGTRPLRRPLRKFAVHHLLKFGAARQLLKAPPILGPLGFSDAGASSFEIQFVFLAGTNCLEVLLSVFFFHHCHEISFYLLLLFPSDGRSNSW